LKKVALVLASTVLALSLNSGAALAKSTNHLEGEVNEVIGTPYLYGGTTTKGFDCSGFIKYIFNKLSIELPRTTKTQAETGVKVSKKDLQLGDLVFFDTFGKGISHAGIYIGDDLFAHSSSKKGVAISKLSEDYYEKRYVTARRVVDKEEYKQFLDDHEDKPSA
jgi:cell wall-associated NlpC family hydrolase